MGFKPKVERQNLEEESMLFSDVPRIGDNESFLRIPVMRPDHRASQVNPNHRTFFIDDSMPIDKLLELEESKIMQNESLSEVVLRSVKEEKVDQR